jgi:hypothetical protein
VAVAPLFFGLLLLVWLGLGTAGWVLATLLRRRAAFFALSAALATAIVGGMLPALLGWRTFPGLLFGLLLALVGSAAAAWQTMSRIPGSPGSPGAPGAMNDGPAPTEAETGEQDA